MIDGQSEKREKDEKERIHYQEKNEEPEAKVIPLNVEVTSNNCMLQQISMFIVHLR